MKGIILLRMIYMLIIYHLIKKFITELLAFCYPYQIVNSYLVINILTPCVE